MANFELRGQGQVMRWTNGAGNNDADWVNVLRFLNEVDGTPGRQMRPKVAIQTSTIPDSPALHAAFTIKELSIQVSLGYYTTDSGALLNTTDALQHCAVRLVTGRVGGGYTAIAGFKENLPNSILMAYFGVSASIVAAMQVPSKASVPMPSLLSNFESFLVGYGRRLVLRLREDIAVGANAGFAVQMKSYTNNMAIEYDVGIAGTV